jgi:hypothetical protein
LVINFIPGHHHVELALPISRPRSRSAPRAPAK